MEAMRRVFEFGGTSVGATITIDQNYDGTNDKVTAVVCDAFRQRNLDARDILFSSAISSQPPECAANLSQTKIIGWCDAANRVPKGQVLSYNSASEQLTVTYEIHQ